MATLTSMPAKGKVIAARDGIVIFQPAGTNYELHLVGKEVSTPAGIVQAIIRVRARKVYTVPSGGNFVSPILGTPRTIQGRVRALDEREMVVQAGMPILVELPDEDSAFDLGSGPITVGSIVNVVALPGAGIDLR